MEGRLRGMRDRLRRAAGRPTVAEAFIGAIVAFAIAATGVHVLGKDQYSLGWVVLLLTAISMVLGLGCIRLIATVRK